MSTVLQYACRESLLYRGRGNRQPKRNAPKPSYLADATILRERGHDGVLRWYFGEEPAFVLIASPTEEDLVLVGTKPARREYKLRLRNAGQVQRLAGAIHAAIVKVANQPESGHNNFEWENGKLGAEKQVYQLLLRWHPETEQDHIAVGARVREAFDRQLLGVSGSSDWADVHVSTLRGLVRTLDALASYRNSIAPIFSWSDALESIWPMPAFDLIPSAATTRSETLQQQLLGQRTGIEPS